MPIGSGTRRRAIFGRSRSGSEGLARKRGPQGSRVAAGPERRPVIPPGDRYLQAPNRALLAPEAALRRRLFRPVASPGVVVKDGRLAGLWRVKARGKKDEIAIEKLRRLSRKDVEEEAGRIAELRGVGEPVLVLY
ncbi:MAG TPA: crosslink repair DNA glycosylase YcaQ family protein [Solirubrobacteraceae bacterium]|nr:crosslink repair DNA glycosylase YcaQ family protein [Solirubrobacteraceae bacterium]